MGFGKLFGLSEKEEKKLAGKMLGEEEYNNERGEPKSIFEEFREDIEGLTLKQLLVFKKIISEEIEKAAKKESEEELIREEAASFKSKYKRR